MSFIASAGRPRLDAKFKAFVASRWQSRCYQSIPKFAGQLMNHLESRVPERSVNFAQKLRIALERHGDPLVTCANIIQLSGFACSDALHLQTIMIFGNGGMALFFLTRMPPMKVPFAWAFLKVCVNVFMVFKLTSERQPVKLSADEFEIYEEHFMPNGITARQFQKLWNLGETRTVQPNTRLLVEGKPLESVSLVLSGHVFRTSRGRRLAGLDTYPGARQGRDGDAGAWVGEIFALPMIDTISAPESVSRDLYRRKMEKALGQSVSAEEATDAVASEQQLSVLKGSKKAFGVDVGIPLFGQEQLENIVQNSLARWTVQSGEGVVVVRSWEIRPLLSMCKTNTEMSGLLRKAFSQSAIKKLLAMESGTDDTSLSIKKSTRNLYMVS
jgi:hypothetical protein